MPEIADLFVRLAQIGEVFQQIHIDADSAMQRPGIGGCRN
jgi:hypothetical protein